MPDTFQSLWADASSYLPFRALLSMFPPSGGEVPDRPKLSDSLTDDYGIGALSPIEESAKDQAIIDYRTKRMGNVFVTASDCGIVSNDRFIARYALMNTTSLHVFDGRVFWLDIYDKATGKTTCVAIGAGQNTLPLVDLMNPHVAGLVFSVMHHSRATMLQVAEAHGGQKFLTDGVSGFPQSRELLLAEADKALGARRAMATTFDLFSRLIAQVRRTVGMEVVGAPPSAENAEVEELSIVASQDV